MLWWSWKHQAGFKTLTAPFNKLGNFRNMLVNPKLWRWSWKSHEMTSMSGAWIYSFTLLILLPASEDAKWKTVGCSRKTKWETETMGSKEVRDKKKKREEEDGKFYLDNLIISHLQSTSMDAPSLHQPVHCEDGASDAGQPVDFPLSLSQRGPAWLYISRSGHADSHCHPSTAANTTTQLWTPGVKYNTLYIPWADRIHCIW